MKQNFISIFCFFIFFFTSSSFAENLVAKSILVDIKEKGEAKVCYELYSNKKSWDVFLSNIASGKNEWVEIALSVLNGSDAGVSEMIILALGEALEHYPENVIRAVSNRNNLNWICAGPDIDDSRYNSYELAMNAINRRIAKIASVKNNALEEKCDRCIKNLQNAKKGIAAFYP